MATAAETFEKLGDVSAMHRRGFLPCLGFRSSRAAEEISGDRHRRDLRRSPRGIGGDGSRHGASTAGASSDRRRRTRSPTTRPSPRHSLPPHTTSTAAASASPVRVGLGFGFKHKLLGSLDDTPNLRIYSVSNIMTSRTKGVWMILTAKKKTRSG
uniref:Uncharacterized protein n=1 Tax=Ananas comosus var. bracteatus TaxID=296719 RepID=A0A6V7NIY8_ANACO|nr:unnamed protein product [Ananas comosus var. bracteatus]